MLRTPMGHLLATRVSSNRALFCSLLMIFLGLSLAHSQSVRALSKKTNQHQFLLRTIRFAELESAITQNPPEPTPLELGVPVEREIAAGQKHTYQLTLAQGQCVGFEVRQMGVDVRATLIQPDGKTIPILSIFHKEPKVNFERVVESSGLYRLEVFTRARAPLGRYEIRIAKLRAATEDDRAMEQAREFEDQAVDHLRVGESVAAIALLLRALEIYERLLGPDHLQVADLLETLGTAQQNVGDLANAEASLMRALRIKQQIFGPDRPGAADVYRQLGDMYEEKGDYVKAEEVLQKALAIFEKTLDDETINLSSVLMMLGDIYYLRDEYAKSETYYRRAIAILERLLGPDNYHLVDVLSVLGRLAYDSGDYQKAEAMFQRSLALTEKALGSSSLEVAAQLTDLGMLYITTRNYAKADTLLQRALTLHERQGMTDVRAQDTLLGLARLNAVRGALTEAVTFQTRATEVEERFVGLNLALGSEREKLALLDRLSWGSSRNISFHTTLNPNEPRARELAINTILRHKGRVQDAMSVARAGLRTRLEPENQKLLDQLNECDSELSRLVLNGPGVSSAKEYESQIKALEEKRGDLEAEISRRTAGLYQRSAPVTVSAVQRLIPANAALIEFAVYRPFDPKAPDNHKAYGEPRYVAYVIRPQLDVQWRDLGSEKEIDAQVDNFRQALRDPHRADVQRLARALDERIMQPLRAATGEATQLLLSPDGELSLIPFAALVDERGQYLVQRYSLVYLTSGRDLVRMQVARASKSAPLVVANPLFGEPKTELLTTIRQSTRDVPNRRRRSVVTGSDLADVYFAPLSGTAQEALSIHAVFPEVSILSGSQATESALKQVVAPSILHIATHGFFLQSSGSSAASPVGDPRGISRQSKIENPLLRSGLALSGANLHQAGADDGILTALEASGLNLWGTKLVVLSACDTGVGEVRNGEGIYGLRRAFVLAGAESLVMSLWPVSDYTTRTLMTSYYKNLKQGIGRADSLRQVQLEMLKHNPKLHPFYWASFIQSGEWAPLDR